MVLASERAGIADSGWRNILRKVPIGCVLYSPALPEGFEAGVIKDYSGQGNNGTITGATWERLPSGLWVLSYDGSDDITTITKDASLQIATTFAVEVWMKWRVVYGTGDASRPVTSSAVAATDINYFFYQENDTLVFYTTAKTSGSVVIVADTWYHWVGVYVPSTSITLYKNGVVASTNTTTIPAAATTTDTDVILGTSWSASDLFNGWMALLRIYNPPPSAAVIAEHYNKERHLFEV